MPAAVTFDIHAKYLDHVRAGLPAILAAVAALTDTVELHSVQTVSEILELLNSSSELLQAQSDQPYIIGPGIASFRKWLILLLERLNSGETLNPPFAVRRTLDDFEAQKAWIVEASRAYIDYGTKARSAIAKTAQPLFHAIQEPSVLIPVCDEAVSEILVEYAKSGRRFEVYLVQPLYLGTEADAEVHNRLKACHNGLAHRLKELHVKVTDIAPQAFETRLIVHRHSIVLTAAFQICANGAVIAAVGTSQSAIVAKAHNKPFYVACETFKLSNTFHLGPLRAGEAVPALDMKMISDAPTIDLTDPSHITSLIMEKRLVSPAQAGGQYVKTWF